MSYHTAKWVLWKPWPVTRETIKRHYNKITTGHKCVSIAYYNSVGRKYLYISVTSGKAGWNSTRNHFFHIAVHRAVTG